MAKSKSKKLKPVKNFRMASIKSKNSKIELILRRELWRRGLRFYVHYSKIIGKPDIVFSRKKIAIFIDSHFWHGYNWRKLKKKLKNKFWLDKISNNIKRDRKINKLLMKEGWLVIRYWEHDIQNNLTKIVNKIEKIIKKP